MKIRLPWHPDKYVNQLHYDGASIFHNISTKMQNLSFAADVDDYLLVSLCKIFIFVTCLLFLDVGDLTCDM